MNTNEQKRAKNCVKTRKKRSKKAMALTERQNEILRRLKENKTAVVSELAKDLYVSEATIRRDLAEMKK